MARSLGIVAILAGFLLGDPSLADADAQDINIELQLTELALLELAESTGTQIMFSPGIANDRTSVSVNGYMTVEQALLKLLDDTGLVFESPSDYVYVIKSVDTDPFETRFSESDSASLDSLLSSAAASISQAAAAQRGLPEIIITGSRLKLEASQVARQVITITADDLAAIGEPDLGRALARMPQNFGGTQAAGVFDGQSGDVILDGASYNLNGAVSVNLRGMGNNETLVLVNGSRAGNASLFGGSSDISGIPMSAVDRVDVILDGASAIYGSDAVGGVINIILKDDYEGLTTNIHGGVPSSGGMSEAGFNVAGTTSWSSGSLTANIDYQRNTRHQALEAGIDSRSNIATGALSGFGDSILGPSGLPGNVYTQSGLEFMSPEGNPAPILADLTPGLRDDVDEGAFQSVTPDEERVALSMYFDHAVMENLHLTGNLLYSRRNTEYDRGLVGIITFLSRSNVLNPTFSTASPERVHVKALYPEFGLQQSLTKTSNFTANLNFEGDITDAWTWELRGNYSENEIDSVQTNPVNGSYVQISNHGFNPWGDGLNNNQATLDTVILNDRDVGTTNKEHGVDLILRGVPFAFAAGDVRTAVGLSTRQVALDQYQETYNLSVTDQGNTGASIGYKDDTQGISDMVANEEVTAIFGEAFIPLIADRRGSQQLDMSLAIRHDKYDNTGISNICYASNNNACFGGIEEKTQYSDTTYSVGLVWSPVDQVRFKADFGTAFVTPDMASSFSPVAADPRRSRLVQPDTGKIWNDTWCVRFPTTYGTTTPTCTGTETTYTAFFGGNPTLKPQTSENLKIATEFQITDKLLFALYYNRTDYSDKVAPVQSLLKLPGSWNAFDHLFTYTDNINIEALDSRVQNLAKEEIRTLDAVIAFEFDIAAGHFTTEVTWTRQLAFDQFLDTHGLVAPIDLIGIRAPKNSALLDLRWNSGDWFASWNSIYRDDGDTVGILSAGGDYTHIDATVLHNMTMGRSFSAGVLKDSRVTLKVTNLTEEKTMAQRYVNHQELGNKHVTGTINDPRGRMLFLDVTKSF